MRISMLTAMGDWCRVVGVVSRGIHGNGALLDTQMASDLNEAELP